MSTQPGQTVAQRTGAAAPSAVLVLDGEGRIQAASAGAGSLWQAKPAELVGELFPTLFAFEVTSRGPGWIQSQWEVLLAAAVDTPLRLQLQPRESAPFDCEIRLEQVSSDPAGFFAFACRPVAPPVVTAPPPADTAESLVNLLNERSPLGFFDLNFTAGTVFYSAAWKKLLGYAPGDLADTYESWTRLLHPEDTAAAPDRKARGSATGPRPFSVEFRMQHARGHYVWIQSVGVQLYGPNGALQRVVGANLDIQDRKEFEEAGLRADERQQAVADDGRLGLFDLDFATGVFWYSPAFLRLVGCPESDATASADVFAAALPGGITADGLVEWFSTPQPADPAFSLGLTLRDREGREVPVQAGVTRLRDRRGALQRAIGYVLPATATATSGLPSPHLSVLLRDMREGALFADAHGRAMLANAQALKLLGLREEQVLGQEVGEIFRLVHRLSGQPGETPTDRVLSGGENLPLNDEFALDLGAGRSCPVTYSCHPVGAAGGAPVGAVLIFRNPEEMSLTPEELIRANRFDSLGQLAGGIAHDFNNLLTTILGGVSLAKDARDSSGLENSERACLAAKGLSKQLLTFSKGGTAVRQTVKTADIITDAVRLAASGTIVKVEPNLAADLGPVCVDRAQILQVFQNLIINAIQAMGAKGGNIWINGANVTLTEGQIAPLPAGPYVAVEVRDNGSGIKPEHLEKIFSPFFTTKKTGTGLGLATVVSIVKRHGGQLTVESEVGVGTAFTVFLPPAQDEVQVEARRAPHLNVATRTGRILFMDDDPQIAHLTGSMLQGLDYKYDLAKNGEEAVQLYKRYLNIGRPYDVVIMDLTIIGGMGGEQTFKVLRELDPNVRAIIASGYDNDEMARQFLDMGFLGYLTKPYRVGDLSRILKAVLGN